MWHQLFQEIYLGKTEIAEGGTTIVNTWIYILNMKSESKHCSIKINQLEETSSQVALRQLNFTKERLGVSGRLREQSRWKGRQAHCVGMGMTHQSGSRGLLERLEPTKFTEPPF